MNPEQKTEFNPQEVAKIAASFIGEKPITQVCSETTLSRSIVYRILYGKLKSPLTIRTIKRFSNGDNEVAKKLLVACGYPESLSEEMDHRLIPENSSFNISDGETISKRTEQLAGLIALLPILKEENKGEPISILYDFDGSFCAKLSNKTTYAGIPAFVTENEDPYDLLLETYDKLKRSMDKTKNSPATVYIFFTNSAKFFDIIKNGILNLYDDMRVFQLNEGGIIRMCQIKKQCENIENGGDLNALNIHNTNELA